MAAAPAPVQLPPEHPVLLPGRGRVMVREVEGPPGAPVLVLLHGWTVTADLNWFASYGPLGQHFRVIAFDHRGHGQGIRSWRPFRLEDCADDVAALAAEWEIPSLIAVGYSMGGPIAQLLWRRHPHLVDGLVLCSTARNFSSPDLRTQLWFSGLLGLSVAARLTPVTVRRQVAGNLVRRRLEGWPLAEWGVEQMEANDHSAVLQAGWAIGRFDSAGWIGEVDVPTAVLVTTLDQVVAPRRQYDLHAAIAGAELIEVEGDHGACVTDPGRFVPALVQACAGVSRSPIR